METRNNLVSEIFLESSKQLVIQADETRDSFERTRLYILANELSNVSLSILRGREEYYRNSLATSIAIDEQTLIIADHVKYLRNRGVCEEGIVNSGIEYLLQLYQK